MEIKIKILIENKNLKLIKGNSSYHIIRNGTTGEVVNDYTSFKYFGKVMIKDDVYEAVTMKEDIELEDAIKVFGILSGIETQTLLESIDYIINIFEMVKYNIDYKKLVGDFGELIFINENKDKDISYTTNNDVYDFKLNKTDFEVKTISGLSKGVMLSKQQLNNNKNAKLWVVSIFQSSDGKSLGELISCNPLFSERYSMWSDNEKALQTRFVVKGFKEFEMSHFSKKVKIGEDAMDYKVTFKIEI